MKTHPPTNLSCPHICLVWMDIMRKPAPWGQHRAQRTTPIERDGQGQIRFISHERHFQGISLVTEEPVRKICAPPELNRFCLLLISN